MRSTDGLAVGVGGWCREVSEVLHQLQERHELEKRIEDGLLSLDIVSRAWRYRGHLLVVVGGWEGPGRSGAAHGSWAAQCPVLVGWLGRVRWGGLYLFAATRSPAGYCHCH
jgi:hypothetical protein